MTMPNLKALLCTASAATVVVALAYPAARPVVAGGPEAKALHASALPPRSVLVVNTAASPVPVAPQRTTDAHVTNASLPVTVERTLEGDGKPFDVTKPADPDPVLTVPAGVVLTDAHVTFSTPENFPNSAALYVANNTQTFVYQLVNNTTFHAGVDLGSGIMSDGHLKVALSCYGISTNHCVGTIM